MKVAVCVKHVPAGRVRMHPDTLRIERSGPGELNTFDKHAIEAALRIAESDGAETVVVSVGPSDAEESLRTALAMGVDRAVLVSDEAAAGSDLIGTARLLAAVLAREAPELALFGQQASDGGGAVLWAAVADLVRQPFVSQASSLEIGDGAVTVRRETEHGNDVITAPLPALVAVSDAINEPRYTSLKGRMAAKKKPFDVLAIADLGLEDGVVGARGARTEVLGLASPPSRGATVRIDDEAGAPEAIVAFLAERELV
jgi:electron transfer flavoprotein beta subunit